MIIITLVNLLLVVNIYSIWNLIKKDHVLIWELEWVDGVVQIQLFWPQKVKNITSIWRYKGNFRDATSTH